MSVYMRRWCIFHPSRFVEYTDSFRRMLWALDHDIPVCEGYAEYDYSGEFLYRKNTRVMTRLPSRR